MVVPAHAGKPRAQGCGRLENPYQYRRTHHLSI